MSVDLSDIAYAVQTAAAFYMTGVIWLVQLLVYPAFAAVASERFAAHHRAHTTIITPVVAPAMIVELAAAGWTLLFPPTFVSVTIVRVAFALVAVAWASTFLLQVPEHGRLEAGFDADAHRRLVRTNWVRTAAWTLRAGLLAAAFLI